MQLPDLINAIFEFGIGLLAIGNVRAILRDKEVKGMFWPVTAWASLWGWWNLYYYPHLGQWISFAAGITIAATNTIWLVLFLYYSWLSYEQRRGQTQTQETSA